MTHAIRTYCEPIIIMNRRVSIGGGVLALILAGEIALTLFRPLV